MRRALATLPIFFILASCAHNGRKLSEEERLKHGLTGIAYDLPLCPTSYDPATRSSRVTGPCELVTCEQKLGKIECTARRKEK